MNESSFFFSTYYSNKFCDSNIKINLKIIIIKLILCSLKLNVSMFGQLFVNILQI